MESRYSKICHFALKKYDEIDYVINDVCVEYSGFDVL